jgi:hypothetical protein
MATLEFSSILCKYFSEFSDLFIFSGMIMAVITLPLGLLQEFTIYHKRGEARDECKNAHGHDCGLNTIQLGKNLEPISE